SGGEVSLSLAPLGDEPADGARFESSSDGGATWTAAGARINCVIDAQGGCAEAIRVVGTAPGGYGLTAKMADRVLPNKATGEASDNSPVAIWFKAGAPTQGEIALADNKDKAANYGQVTPPDAYRLDIWVRDGQGHGVTGLADANFTKTCLSQARAGGCPASEGVLFGAVAEDTGLAGHYTVAVSATKAGVKKLAIGVTGVTGSLPKKGDPTARFVTATFTAMPDAVPGQSSFAITSTDSRVAWATNEDNPDYFHTGLVTLKDANGNPITAAANRLTWAETAPEASRVEIAEGAAAGTYDVKIWSSNAGVFSGPRVSFATSGGSPLALAAAESMTFVAGQPVRSESSMTITKNTNQLANYGDPNAKAEDWGKQTITVKLRDKGGNPYREAVGRLFARSPKDGAEGVYYSDPAGVGAGRFGCAAALADGQCTAGVYSLDVHAATAGAKRIAVAFAPSTGSQFDLSEEGSGASYVVAQFATPPAAPDDSVFVLGDPALHPGETAPQDDWDDPTDQADGGDSIAHETSVAFHPGVRVWDAGRNNPVSGVVVKLTLADAADGGACPGRFEEGGGRSVKLLTSSVGKASAAVNSSLAGQCVITATVQTDDGPAAVPGSPKRLTWIDSEIDPAASSFAVSTADVVADGTDSGTVTVTLVGRGGDRLVQAADSIVVSAAADSGLLFGRFAHVGEGVYTATFTGVKAGAKAVAVEAAGEAVAIGGNHLAKMVAGAVSATESWLVRPSGTAPAGGGASLPVKAHLFDANKNPVETGTVKFEIPEGTAVGDQTGPATVTAPVTGGWARIDLTAVKAGPHEVSATVDDAAIERVKDAAEAATVANDGQVRVVFTAGSASPEDSELTIPSAGADGLTTKPVGGAEQHTAQVTVTDANGNRLAAGAASVVFRWSYTDNRGVKRSGSSEPAQTDADGVASYSFGSYSAAEWTIEARLTGATKDVTGSPKTAVFSPAAFDPSTTLASFTVDSGVKKADGVANTIAKMKAQDQYGNGLEGQDLSFILDYQGAKGPLFASAETGQKEATAPSDKDGWTQFRIYSLWPGDFYVKGALAGAATAPQQVHFSNAAADVANSRFAVVAAPTNSAHPKALANGVESYIVTVSLYDADGTPLNDAGAAIHMTPRNIAGAREERFNVVSGQAGKGQVRLPLTTVKAGLWDISVKIGNDLVGTEADPSLKVATIEFSAGLASVDDPRTQLFSPVHPAKADGAEEQIVRAEVADSFGNAVSGGRVLFTIPAETNAKLSDAVTIAGPNKIELSTSDGSDGLAPGVVELTLVSTKTGVREVTASVGGAQIKTGSPAKVTFTNADLSAQRSEFDIPTASEPKTVVSQYHTPRVTLRDASDNLYTPASLVRFYYRLDGETDWQVGPAITTAKGVALWEDFTVSLAGTYQVRANTGAGQVPDAETVRYAVFEAGAVSLKDSILEASTGSVLPNGKDSHSVKVTVRDSLRNPVLGELVTFTLPADDASSFVAPCQPKTCQLRTSALGWATVRVVASDTVSTQVQASLGAGLVGSARLTFEAGSPDADKSAWAVTPPNPLKADGQAAFTGTVQVNDSTGLPKVGAKVDFSYDEAFTISPPGPYVSDSSGQVKVQFTATKAGTYTVNANIGANPIKEVDRKLRFIAGDVSTAPGDTFLTPPPSPATADGQAVQVVTATVRDAFGNPVDDAVVRFAAPGGAGVAGGGTPEVATDGRGQARIAFVTTTAGIYEVTAEVRRAGQAGWTAITGGSPARAVFNAGTVDLTESWISKDLAGPLEADGEQSYTVKVELKDEHGNPVKLSGTPIDLTFRLVEAVGAPGPRSQVRHLATGPDGIVKTAFATTRAGAWRVSASLGAGEIVGGSPLGLVFQAGAASGASSTLETTANTVLADGKAEHSAWVVVRDANGNPVTDQDVEFSIEEGAQGVAGPTLSPADGLVSPCRVSAADSPEWCDQDGKALVTIRSKEPGSFQVSAAIGGTAVTDSPREVSFDAGWPDSGRSAWTLTPDTAASPSVQLAASGDPNDSYSLRAKVYSASNILVPEASVRITGLDTTRVTIVEAGGVEGRTGKATSDNYGSYTWRLYSDKAGTYTGSVEVNTGGDRWEAVTGGQFTLRFGAGTGQASESWLIQPTGGATANGTDTVTIRAHLRDINRNDLDAGNAVFSVPAGLTAVVGSAETTGGDGVTVVAPVASGYAAVDYKTTTAGNYSVSASVNAMGLLVVKDAGEETVVRTDGRVGLEFGAGTASATHSTLTVPTAAAGGVKVADGTPTHRAEVVVKDEHGNLKAGTPVMFRYGLTAASAEEKTVKTGTDGLASVDFGSAEAGTFTVRAYVMGKEVAESPASAEFVAGEFSLETTLASFEVQTTSGLATGTSELWARMRATDQKSNPIKDKPLGFRLTGGGVGPVFTPLAEGRKEVWGTSGPDGWVTVQIVSEFEGSFPVMGLIEDAQTEAKPVKFANDAADPARSHFTVERNASNRGDPAVADGLDSYQVEVNFRNADGDPLNGVSAVVKVTGPDRDSAYT
ncbi:MAG: Ig-like domain-containing protein, partial [Bifidobacteriaceae bacterium]|nr:Ig-like domain-containing protein [Bifidobacteriaceae bacterium]